MALARRKHPFPFRTRQLSSSAPMVLHAQVCGRVGRRRELILETALVETRGPFVFSLYPRAVRNVRAPPHRERRPTIASQSSTPRINRQIRKTPVRSDRRGGHPARSRPRRGSSRRRPRQAPRPRRGRPPVDPAGGEDHGLGQGSLRKGQAGAPGAEEGPEHRGQGGQVPPDSIGDADFERKVERARRFLEKGKKVKATVFFRYRQLRRPDLGTEILQQVAEQTADLGQVESRSGLEGRRMITIIAPSH